MKMSRLFAIMILLLAVSGMVSARGSLIPRDAVLVIDLGGDIPETVPWNPIMSLFEEPMPIVLDKLTCLKMAAEDGRVKGVVARISKADYSFGKAQEFREAIERFKQKSNKPIYAYLELEDGGNIEYYLASACDRVYVSPASTLGLTGLATFRFYLGGLWEKIYLDVQVDQIKEYKSAADMIGRRNMSDAEREVTNSILDSLYGQFVADIADARGVGRDVVKQWIDEAWIIPEKYREAGAIDGIKYLDQIITEIGGGQMAGISDKDFMKDPLKKPVLRAAPKVAVIFGIGGIVSGGQPQSPFGTGNVIASDVMVKKLIKALEDDSIDAVIYRVDSGGGSALASDLIWRATQRVKVKKPIVVSMSDVAGSGGYYISCGASSIVAQPGTITGSIGILTAHISAERLLKKIQVGTEIIGRGKYSEMGRPDRKMTDAEMAKTHDTIASLYTLFITRVGEGRGLSTKRVNEIGRGRIWTGAQAVEIGLVDKLGGYEAAIMEVKRLLNYDPEKKVELVYGHEEVTFWKLLTGKIEKSIEESVISSDERELIHALRIGGLWRPGQALAIMAGPMRVR